MQSCLMLTQSRFICLSDFPLAILTGKRELGSLAVVLLARLPQIFFFLTEDAYSILVPLKFQITIDSNWEELIMLYNLMNLKVK